MKIERKSLITAGGTLLCALGIGYFMQAGSQPPQGAAPAPAVSTAGMMGGGNSAIPATEVHQPEAPEVALSQVTLTSAAPTKPVMPDLARLPTPPLVEVALEQEPEAGNRTDQAQPQLACDHQMTATPEAAAMVRLTLSAPCMVNERFTLHHNGMMLSHVTDEAGMGELVVPALAESAVFIAAFANGEGAVATADVEALAFYDRAVIQWQGAAGMQLHAFEFGADYSGDGHVWAGDARDLSAASAGTGGFITRHGDSELDEALVAEVYTFPTGTIQRSGQVVLSVEAEVTRANCGRDVEAQSLQKTVDGRLKTQSLVLAMPDCDAVGDFLLLKNLLNDLKVAAK